MSELTSALIISTWYAFSDTFISENKDWQSSYKNNKKWSQLFLGGKKSLSTNSPIGNYFEKSLDLKYRMEDGSFDLAFWTKKNYSKLQFINRGKPEIFSIENTFYPIIYDLVIEIENDMQRAWQEMTKLVWVRCRFKVLVTYFRNTYDEPEKNILINNFREIINQSHGAFPENPESEYILFIGYVENNMLKWVNARFNYEGKEMT